MANHPFESWVLVVDRPFQTPQLAAGFTLEGLGHILFFHPQHMGVSWNGGIPKWLVNSGKYF